jgi:hypothetical protein
VIVAGGSEGGGASARSHEEGGRRCILCMCYMCCLSNVFHVRFICCICFKYPVYVAKKCFKYSFRMFHVTYIMFHMLHAKLIKLKFRG